MSMVPDRPWPTRPESGVLYTVTPLISSDGYWSNSTLRLSPVLTISRPLSSVVAKSGDRPRTLITWARPATRWAARPGRRAIDSAMLTSGSLPMSSAEMASTMEVESRLTEMALSMPRRMPVTVTVSRLVASVAVSWAWTPVALSAMADARAALSRLRLGCMFPLSKEVVFGVRVRRMAIARILVRHHGGGPGACGNGSGRSLAGSPCAYVFIARTALFFRGFPQAGGMRANDSAGHSAFTRARQDRVARRTERTREDHAWNGMRNDRHPRCRSAGCRQSAGCAGSWAGTCIASTAALLAASSRESSPDAPATSTRP